MDRRTTLFWSIYDFATTPVAFAVNAMYLPLMVLDSGGTMSTVGLLPMITGAVAATWTPVVGALIDRSSEKALARKATVVISAIIGGASIGVMGQLNSLTGLLLAFAVMTLAVQTGWTGMNSFLAQEGEAHLMGTTSAIGVVMGYTGGALGAGVTVLVDRVLGRAAALTFVGGFLAVFGSVSVLLVREHRSSTPTTIGLGEALRESLRAIRNDCSLRAYIVGSILWGDAVSTVMSFASILAVEVLSLSAQETLAVVATALPCALAGAFVHGRVGDRIGLVKAQAANLALWAVGFTSLALAGANLPAWLVAVVAGFALGGNMALTRALYARIVPRGMEARLFGFAVVFAFFGGTVGPFITGLVADLPGMTLQTALVVPLAFVLLSIPTLPFIEIRGPFEDASIHSSGSVSWQTTPRVIWNTTGLYQI
ncbi:MAG: MFS transporter [Candidatus Thorarchaeota archaeon]